MEKKLKAAERRKKKQAKQNEPVRVKPNPFIVIGKLMYHRLRQSEYLFIHSSYNLYKKQNYSEIQIKLEQSVGFQVDNCDLLPLFDFFQFFLKK